MSAQESIVFEERDGAIAWDAIALVNTALLPPKASYAELGSQGDILKTAYGRVYSTNESSGGVRWSWRSVIDRDMEPGRFAGYALEVTGPAQDAAYEGLRRFKEYSPRDDIVHFRPRQLFVGMSRRRAAQRLLV